MVILLILPRLAFKQLEVGTDVLLIQALVMSFLRVSTSMTLNNLKPQNRVFLVILLAISGSDTHFKSEFRIKLLLFYCMLYTDCQSGRTAAIARYVSFAQITCSNYFDKIDFIDCSVTLPRVNSKAVKLQV